MTPTEFASYQQSILKEGDAEVRNKHLEFLFTYLGQNNICASDAIFVEAKRFLLLMVHEGRWSDGERFYDKLGVTNADVLHHLVPLPIC